jgi:hypothetical protein
MRLDRKDQVATACVAASVALYGLWSIRLVVSEAWTVRIITVAVLALGIPASAMAVIPGFEGLLHGSKVYLAVSTLIGLGAATVGVLALTWSSQAMLNALVGAMVVLWAMATVRHTRATHEVQERRLRPVDLGGDRGVRPAA